MRERRGKGGDGTRKRGIGRGEQTYLFGEMKHVSHSSASKDLEEPCETRREGMQCVSKPQANAYVARTCAVRACEEIAWSSKISLKIRCRKVAKAAGIRGSSRLVQWWRLDERVWSVLVAGLFNRI